MKSFMCFMGAAVFSTVIIHANCGLGYCPRRASTETAPDNSVTLKIENTAFNLDSGSGYYAQILPGYEYSGIHSWVIGGNLPVVALTVHSRTPPNGSKTTPGISNPLLYASWYTHVNMNTMLYLGLQLELPLGNFDAGMAGNHVMLVPYVLMERTMGFGSVMASLGYCQAFSMGDGGEHPVYVNPHEDREILYRAGASLQQLNGTLKQRIYLDGRYAVVDELEGPGRSHLSGGMALDFAPGDRLILSPSVDLPFSDPGRFDWRGGLEAKVLF